MTGADSQGRPAIGLDAAYADAFGQLEDFIVVLRAERVGQGAITGLRIAYANPAWRRAMLPLGAGDPAGRLVDEAVPAMARSMDRLRMVVETGVPSRAVHTPDNGAHWHDVQYARLGDGIVSVGRDITEQQRLTEALATAGDDLREAQRVSRTGSYTYDIATDTATWSDELNAIYGRPPGTPAPSVDELDRLIPGGGHLFREAVGQAVADGAAGTGFEHPIRRRDGSLGWVLTRGRVEPGPDGRPARILGTETDITALRDATAALQASEDRQRQASRLLEGVFASLAEGVVAHGVDGRVTAANASASAMLGISADQLIGSPLFQPTWGVTDEGGATLAADELPAAQVLATGQPTGQRLFSATLPGGRRSWFRVAAVPMLDADGTLTGAVTSFANVTSERALEAQVRQGQRLEAVGQFAGGIAHDFNNLLAAIRAFGELIAGDSPEGSQTWDDATQLLLATDRAATLTRQLLAYTRQQVLEPRVVAPAAVVDALVPMLRRLMGSHIELVATAAPETGLVRVDPGQLEQVIVNLAVNARDAMAEGGQLSISLDGAERGTVSQGDQALLDVPVVRILVADSGGGMPEATLDRIFEPFFTTKQTGSGLGLSTVRTIVEQCGGRIQVRSTPGEGTTFTIELPRVASVAEAANPVARDATGGGGLRVLLVDDDAAVRAGLARLMGMAGYIVTTADSGDAALEVAAGATPLDLVLCDVQMPDMVGPDVVARIRALRPGLPAVMISGYAPSMATKSREVAGAEYLQKPFGLSDVDAAVTRLLGADRGPELPR